MNLKDTAIDTLSKVKTYWKNPMKGRYMTFREIVAYSGGGIGAYMLITLGSACILSINNYIFLNVLGIQPNDIYIMYLIAVIVNIPLTGVRANIIDNTRNKAGKYRPYIVTMGIPTAIICITMVWFPYDKLKYLVGEGAFSYVAANGEIVEKTYAYIAQCALLLVLNILLHFFYYFFYDGYENLIHVLSPNTQERADVASIKSVVYSLAPSIVNFLSPFIAGTIFKSNETDIRVYKLLYPILGVFGILLCIVVYKYTEEKIVQARTHVVQVRFTDALREVAKNKYFWIISLAGWLGFLENSYGMILRWLHDYGGHESGAVFGIIQTIYGNASLWGMLLAPFCIRKWGKKKVLVVTNFMNIAFILLMLPVTTQITGATIWMVMGCLYLNAFMGSFAHILNPTIQADIRDFQQYKSGERIDGMFSAVGTIGTVITLATSSVLPAIYSMGGMTEANARAVTSRADVLNRMLGDGKTVGQILSEQMAAGQNNYTNAASALYDPDVLKNLIHILVIVSAVGALMNVIPYFWYDFNERKQQSVIRVLKVRSMFEDYGNGVIKDEDIVEGTEIVRTAREMVAQTPKVLDKKSYKSIADKAERKAAKKQYNADFKFNEEIEIAKFVCDELDKYLRPEHMAQLEASHRVYSAGLDGLVNMNISEINHEIGEARSMPKSDFAAKEARSAAIYIAKNKKVAYKAIKKNFPGGEGFVKPDFAVLEDCFNAEDACDELLKDLYLKQAKAKKEKDNLYLATLKNEINAAKAKRKELVKATKAETDRHANFNRAAKPYLDAEKMIKQAENYKHFEEIEALYEDAKVRLEEKAALEEAQRIQREAEEKAFREQKKSAKKANKK